MLAITICEGRQVCHLHITMDRGVGAHCKRTSSINSTVLHKTSDMGKARGNRHSLVTTPEH